MTTKTKKPKRDWFQTMAQRQQQPPQGETEEPGVLQIERGPATVIISSKVEEPVRRSFLKF